MGEILPDGTIQGYSNYKGKTNMQGDIVELKETKKANRILNVKKISKTELQEKWDVPVPLKWSDDLYIRCNAKGIVNWDIAPVYQPAKLIEIGNYKVHY